MGVADDRFLQMFFEEARERGGTVDERDANRGPIAKEDFDRAAANPSSPEGQVFKNIQRLIEVRKQRKSLRRVMMPGPCRGGAAILLSSQAFCHQGVDWMRKEKRAGVRLAAACRDLENQLRDTCISNHVSN